MYEGCEGKEKNSGEGNVEVKLMWRERNRCGSSKGGE